MTVRVFKRQRQKETTPGLSGKKEKSKPRFEAEKKDVLKKNLPLITEKSVDTDSLGCGHKRRAIETSDGNSNVN